MNVSQRRTFSVPRSPRGQYAFAEFMPCSIAFRIAVVVARRSDLRYSSRMTPILVRTP
jgi:hypothetical protein